LLRRIIGENIDLITLTEPHLRSVTVDRGQMEQVLMNLAVNARDAMPMGGKITIETANVNIDRAQLAEHGSQEFEIRRPGPHVMLVVTDTGLGMDAETRARIF